MFLCLTKIQVGIAIPGDMKPSTILVSLAKSTVENTFGQLEMDWGKFVALLGLAGNHGNSFLKCQIYVPVSNIDDDFI